MRRALVFVVGVVSAWLMLTVAAHAQALVPLKDLGRIQGWRDSPLVGYGIVTGLTGTGDSPRNPVTQRAISNAVGRLGSNIEPEDIRSRNVAAVMVTAVLPSSANYGDRIDVTVTSIGDARSLTGGVLMMTPLVALDDQPYAVAQGPLVVGGYQFSSRETSAQRNTPTVGVVSNGATIERAVYSDVVDDNGHLVFFLRNPDVTTAVAISDRINFANLGVRAWVSDADSVIIDLQGEPDIFRIVSRIEQLDVPTSSSTRVVVNERTGTVVAGAGVRISSVSIAQGDIRVTIQQTDEAVVPDVVVTDGGRSGILVRNTSIDVEEGNRDIAITLPDTTVGDLMEALGRAGVDTRGKISILQAIKAAGALHADIIVQ